MKKNIVSVWIKDLEIKVAFNDGHIMTKKCNSKEELKISYETVMALCHSMGSEIKLNE